MGFLGNIIKIVFDYVDLDEIFINVFYGLFLLVVVEFIECLIFFIVVNVFLEVMFLWNFWFEICIIGDIY